MKQLMKFDWRTLAAATTLSGLVASACQSEGEGNPDLGENLGVSRNAIVTNLSGYAYTDQCLAQGVPVPPHFNYDACKANPQEEECGAGWVYNGTLNTLNGGTAELFYYVTGPTPANPNQPEGLCVAFPRFFSNPSDNLAGVICQGNAASKACFWDRPSGGYTQDTTVCYSATQDAGILCSPATGGEELVDEPLAQCSDCHAGENAFIVHPNQNAFKNIPWDGADNWVQPIVKDSWPTTRGRVCTSFRPAKTRRAPARFVTDAPARTDFRSCRRRTKTSASDCSGTKMGSEPRGTAVSRRAMSWARPCL